MVVYGFIVQVVYKFKFEIWEYFDGIFNGINIELVVYVVQVIDFWVVVVVLYFLFGKGLECSIIYFVFDGVGSWVMRQFFLLYKIRIGDNSIYCF